MTKAAAETAAFEKIVRHGFATTVHEESKKSYQAFIDTFFHEFSEQRIWPSKPFSCEFVGIVNVEALVQVSRVGIGVDDHVDDFLDLVLVP